MLRTGDGSNQYSNIKDLDKALKNFVEDYNNNNASTDCSNNLQTEYIWGWDDQDMTADERSLVKIFNKEEEK